MPFQFTGQAPAFGRQHSSAETDSRPFAFGRTTAAPLSTNVSGPTFDAASAFRRNSSLWAAASRPSPFGSDSSEDLFRPAAAAHNSVTPPYAANTTRATIAVKAAGDDFSEALLRTSKGVKAAFGRKHIAADNLLEEILAESSVAPSSIAQILEGMQAHPELAALAGCLFAKTLAKGNFAGSSVENAAPGLEDRKSEDIFAVFRDRARPHLRSTTLSSKTTEVSIATKDSIDPPSQATLPNAITDGKATTSQDNAKVSRFMDIPTEIRLNVYRQLLLGHDNYIVLGGMTMAKLYKYKVVSGISTSILRVNKQVLREAKDILYKENTVTVVADVHVSNHPIITKLLMPDHVLSKLVSLVLVCETCTNGAAHQVPRGADFEKRMIWRQLQDLTALKFLRLVIVERENQRNAVEQREDMLASIIQRIPANCRLSYGSKEETEKNFVAEAIKETDEPDRKEYYKFADSYEVGADVVEKCTEAAMRKVAKGCKPGDTTDYRFPKRTFTLGALGGGSIDPRFVLGSGGN